MSPPKAMGASVLITGTTSGVGRALLAYYLSLGARIVAVNRRRVPELEAVYPSVRFECVDVRHGQEVARLVRGLADSGALPEIFLLNAGINRIDNDESFRLETYREVMETNLFGVLNFVAPLTLTSREKPRRIVAISSMAAYIGNPYGLGYHASKRALSACFDVWAPMYSGTDLSFKQVMLGPVRTPIFTMSDRLPSWMVRMRQAFSASPEDAARAIAKFAASRRKKLYWPLRAVPLYWGMWTVRALVSDFFRGRRTLQGDERRTLARRVSSEIREEAGTGGGGAQSAAPIAGEENQSR